MTKNEIKRVYNSANLVRCAMVRGKSKNQMDDLLMLYASIIQEICPCQDSTFAEAFNNKLSRFLNSAEVKTLDNHRTEIAGKLFGMYYTEDGFVYIADQTKRLLETNDQPAFFKEFCFKFQFPNGMESVDTILEKRMQELRIRPCVFIIQLLDEAKRFSLDLTIDEVGYYVLSSLDVLQGWVTPKIVLKEIMVFRQKRIVNVVHFEGKASSYSKQHIRELLNYMELSNLITIGGQLIKLNDAEKFAIKEFLQEDYSYLLFDPYGYKDNEISILRKDYSKFFARLAFQDKKVFETSTDAIVGRQQLGFESVAMDTTELGDLGEKFVFEYEKKKVAEYSSTHILRVLSLGKQRGLGFDIQSVRTNGDKKGQSIFIEVKSTRRVTKPNEDIIETINLTRNEWLAAEQHRDNFFIYRIYFTKDGVFLFVINDPVSAWSKGEIFAEPITYRIEFKGISDNFIKID
ncbi:MAG: DUF3883 domain-containing protein [Bacteriovoracaceae bacterium]|nr:DUF3883 domain-containing protein [Bacteriovoracaceae bacterium]